MRLSLFVLALASFVSIFAQQEKGTLKGTIKGFEEGEMELLPFANLRVTGVENTGAASDFDGNFKISLNPGTYEFVVSHVSYPGQDQKFTATIKAGEITTHNIEFKENVIKTVEVVDKKKETNDVVAREEEKETKGVKKVVSNKEMEQKGVTNVGAAMNKVSGTSFANSTLYVRGLGDRYNTVYMNGLTIPSTNPDLRVLPLDIFPSSILSSVALTKVLNPEFYGDYAGGAIDIRTKEYFNKPTLKVQIGTELNSNIAFKDMKTYSGGKTDFLGYDDGVRNIPSYIESTAKQTASNINPNGTYNSYEGENHRFPQNFNPSSKKSLPTMRFKIEGGNFYNFKDKDGKDKADSGFGFLVFLAQNNNDQYQEGKSRIINTQNDRKLDYDIKRYVKNYQTTAMTNLFFKINKKHSIKINSLFINTAQDEVKESWGYQADLDQYLYSMRFRWRQTNIFVNQLIGESKFGQNDRISLDYGIGYSTTNSKEPDRRTLVYTYDPNNREDMKSYTFFSLDNNANQRFYSDLNETELTGRVSTGIVLAYRKNADTTEKRQDLVTMNLGFNYRNKKRDFIYRQFNYNVSTLSGNNAGITDATNPDSYLTDDALNTGQFSINEITNPAARYEASQVIYAGYTEFDIRATKNFQIIPGFRLEYGSQVLRNRNQLTPIKIDQSLIDGIEWMPSLIFKYSLNDTIDTKRNKVNSHVFRLVGSRTITRPKFNEVAPFEYVEDVGGAISVGNSNLINGTNYNADFKYEYYMQRGQMVSVGLFYKYLQNPIEQTMIAAAGQLQSFQNADMGQVAGIEFEFSKNLSFFLPKSMDEKKRRSNILNYIFVGGNVTAMLTQVKLSNNSSSANTNSVRPLEGASPLMANIDLRYKKRFEKKKEGTDKKKSYDVMVGVSYNVFSKRLSAVGVNGIGDQYQMPVNRLNFVAKTTFNDALSIKLNVFNMINQDINVYQQNVWDDKGDQLINTYKAGVAFRLSLAYSIPFTGKKKKANTTPTAK